MYEELYRRGGTTEEAARRLHQLIHVLRSEDGCPWDREQTHESLKRCLIEETYEVIDAIDQGDMDHLEEELGDVVLQVVMHAEIASERGDFDLASVMDRVSDKMVHRHPHVFNDSEGKKSEKTAETIDNVLEKWENVKRKEHAEKTTTESMRGIPKCLPALIRSEKVQKKAAGVGFDWDSVDDAFAKVSEETQELLDAYRATNRDHIAEEIGDLLFAVVNVARFLDVDPEEALGRTSDKFIRRFDYIERQAMAEGRRPEEMSLAEMDKLWENAKEKEK